MRKRLAIIWAELRAHAPFTMFGSLTGIVCMFAFKGLEHDTARRIFYVFHPGHVLLSAVVITAMLKIYTKGRTALGVLLLGLIGSVGVATLSDSVIPYVGEVILRMPVVAHSHEAAGFAQDAHIGFIEGWYVVMPAAIIGMVIAHFRPKTKIPHAGHILLSTWASAFHMLMAMGGQLSLLKALGSLGFLFLAVWLPCCFSDIVFPLLFVKSASVLPHAHH